MAREVGASRLELEELVASHTRELQQADERAQAADAEKRRLIARGNELVEDERRRISLEIHDDLISALVSGLLAEPLCLPAGRQPGHQLWQPHGERIDLPGGESQDSRDLEIDVARICRRPGLHAGCP
jgi:hypothetical protein